MPIHTFVDETPAGDMDSSNKTFTLTSSPKKGSLFLYHNNAGVTETGYPGIVAVGQYSWDGATTILMGLAPDSGDKLVARYDT